MQSNLSEKSKRYPVIQDILVVPRIIENKMPLGEYHDPAFFGGEAVPVCETSENMLNRLFSRIHDLAQVASRIHTNSMRKTDYMHGITRLITSEFFFILPSLWIFWSSLPSRKEYTVWLRLWKKIFISYWRPLRS